MGFFSHKCVESRAGGGSSKSVIQEMQVFELIQRDRDAAKSVVDGHRRGMVGAIIASGAVGLAASSACAQSARRSPVMTPYHTNPQISQPIIPEMPERDGVVSWKLLAEVKKIRSENEDAQRNKIVVITLTYPPAIHALAGKRVRLHGYMIPRTTELTQASFVLANVPPDCAYCLPGSAERFAMVDARQPLALTNQIVVVEGIFEPRPTADENGAFYTLKEAQRVSA